MSDSEEEIVPALETEMSDSDEIVPAPALFNCGHYARSCKLVAPCCDKVYGCRMCHDEAQSSAPVKESHSLDRKTVEEVVCRECNLRQPVAASCTNCQTVFGKAYFCPICRLYDDTDKQQFHCDGCGICRIGGADNFVHCYTCCLCFKKDMSHKCIENGAKANCPVCMEDIHGSVIAAATPPCGHLLHSNCQSNMFKHGQYACPVCSKAMIDMTDAWSRINQELEETPMPLAYRHLYRNILCNDCNKTGKTKFHVVGMKCIHCGSFNTVMGEGPMVRRVPPTDEHDQETFVELTDEEIQGLTNVPLPIPEGIELSDDEDEEGIEPSDDEEDSDVSEAREARENEDPAVDDATEVIAPTPNEVIAPTFAMIFQQDSEADQIRDLEGSENSRRGLSDLELD